ncbi:MAG: alanine racemase [Candidatus Sumerlaeia bacterium]|nr:alanine racemase [Candidatus Sumerlaeia bacterium]
MRGLKLLPPSDRCTPLLRARNEVTVHLDALANNLGAIRARISPARLLLTVKKDAYGHGLAEVSATAQKAGADYLGIASIGEALALRQAGVGLPILDLGLALPEEIEPALEYGIELTVASLDDARQVSEAAARLGRRARVHLKVDTGMGRLGLLPEQLTGQLDALAALSHLDWVGLYSHLADAAGNATLTNAQWSRFRALANSISAWIPFRHLGASAAIAKAHLHFDMLRVGIAAYGADPDAPEFEPVMTFKSRLVFIKDVPAGCSISYGATYVTTEPTRVGVVAAGYGNGYPRRVSGRGHVMIAGRPAPILGRICMDQMMVNLNRHPETKVGDEVLLFGRSGENALPVWQVAQWAETISYEVLCCVGMMNPRQFLPVETVHKP